MKPFAAFAAAALLGAATPAAGQGLPVGTCINMGNHLEPEREDGWGGKRIEAADFERIAAAGFDTVRIPVRWANKTGAAPGYTLDPAWLGRVAEVVDQALAADLKVILNSHNFEDLHADPAANTGKLAAIWRQVAARFAGRPPERLWFEIENEPHDKLANANLMATLGPALAEIRATNRDRPVVIGGENWSGIDSLATLELPDDPQVYPTFHYYEPFDFTHQGASWAGDPPPPVGRTYGTQADAERLQRDVAKLDAYIERTGRVPFMGETGAYDAHIAPGQRIAYHRAVREAFAPTGIGVCAWAYTNTFPFYDHEAGRWLPGMRGAIGLNEAPASEARDRRPVEVDAVGPRAPSAKEQEATAAALAELQKQLPGTLINDPTRLDWATQGSNFVSEGFADPSIPGGGAARRFEIERAAPDAWAVQAYVPLLSDIARGETVTAGFWARATAAATDDGEGVLGVRFQQNADPWPGFGDTTVELGSAWEWHEVSAVATRSIPQRDAVVVFQLGAARQSVEIGQTIVVKDAPKIVGATAAPSATAQALASLSASIELPPPLRDEPGKLINRPDRRGWGHSGPAGSFAEQDDAAIWLGKATRFTAAGKGANRWDVSTAIPLEEGIAVGDKLLIAIAARTESAATDDGRAVVGIRVQSSEPPHPGFADNLFKVGPNWQLIRVRTTATEAIPAGKATVALHFAEAPQTVDIGPVYVLKSE